MCGYLRRFCVGCGYSSATQHLGLRYKPEAMFASVISKRTYSSVSPDFLASVLQRVKEVPLRSAEANKPKFGKRKPRFTEGSGEGRPRENRQFRNDKTHGNGQDRRDSRNRGARGNTRERSETTANAAGSRPARPVKRDPASKLKGTDEYNDISDNVQKFSARDSRRTPRRPRKTVPGLKLANSPDARSIIQVVNETNEYIPQDPKPLSLLKYKSSLAPTFSSRALWYSLNTLKESNFPLYRAFNEGVRLSNEQGIVNKRMTANIENFGQYTPASDLKLQLEPLTKNFQALPDIERLEQTVKGKYNVLKPFDKKEFASMTKSEETRSALLSNSETVRKSIEQCNLSAVDKELLHKVCSGLAPVSELRA